MKSYTEQLDEWFQAERAAGRTVDVKFFPGVDQEGSIDKLSRAALETLTGKRDTKPLDLTEL